MALAPSELSLLQYSGAVAGGFRLYHYANSAVDTITTNGFFDSLAANFGTGDLMFSGDGVYQITRTGGDIALTPINTVPS